MTSHLRGLELLVSGGQVFINQYSAPDVFLNNRDFFRRNNPMSSKLSPNVF